MTLPPEVRLKRYLCYTSEANVYHPGCRFFYKRYTRENVPSLSELIASGKEDFIFNLIRSIHAEEKSCYPDALLFVLSEMARERRLRPTALGIAEKLCEKVEPFIIFLKFSLENSPKMGFGRSFRKFIRNWYLSKDYLKLAEIVGQIQRYRGWKHADILKLAHIKSTDPAKSACFKYAVSGAEQMRVEFGQVEEAKKVVSYLSTVDIYRKKVDSTEVAVKIEAYMLGIEHINFVVLGDKKVWLALLKQMPVLDVLNHFQFLSKHKMFRNTRNWDFVFVDTLIEALTKPFANRAGVTANRVFIELMNYENAGRIKLELASKMHQVVKKPPILNSELSSGLMQLMDSIIESQKNLGKSLMIAIEISSEMLKRRCYISRYVTLIEAAAFITYYYLRLETSVKVFTFNGDGLKPMATPAKEATVKLLIDHLRSENVPENGTKTTKGDEFITAWIKDQAKPGGEEIDACIILKSYIDNNAIHALPPVNASNKRIRYVVCDLCGLPKNSKPPDKRHVFVSSGFDEKLPDAVSMFINNVF